MKTLLNANTAKMILKKEISPFPTVDPKVLVCPSRVSPLSQAQK